eukprot:GHUV01033823.1.p3 GENE.GHUV01033823.1~~GHUV01033823.1.p3  ORF type:complete len:124 (-),score=27.85 GHUV01033823.1:870-1241(-)
MVHHAMCRAAPFRQKASSCSVDQRFLCMQAPRQDPPALASWSNEGPLERQVFISHTGQDQGACNFAASILKPALKAAGLNVFMDFSNLEPGSEWPRELAVAAANSVVVVVVLSRQYTKRKWPM